MNEIIVVVIPLVLGWLLGQSGGILDRYFAKRQAVELLEIRYRLKGTLYVAHKITDNLCVPYETYDQVFSAMPQGILWDEAISIRFNAAVDTLASFEPIIAFELRSKDIAGVIGHHGVMNFGNTKETFDATKSILRTLEGAMLPTLDGSIIGVASRLGRAHRKWAKQYLDESAKPALEVESYAEQVIGSVNSVLGVRANQNMS